MKGFSSEFISLLEADKRAPSLATLNKIAPYLKKDLRLISPPTFRPFNVPSFPAESEISENENMP